MKKIKNTSLAYRFILRYIKLGMHFYYKKIVVTGTENLPINGRFIFAPNHRNALLDAFSILYVTPKGIDTSFLARADLFKNKRLAALMRFSKILPAFRMRDGFEKLSKNNETFNESVDILLQNQALCIFPEGDQEIELSLRPLVKGIFRVAFSAVQKSTDQQPVFIVPVGIDYGNMQKYGKHLLIQIGQPINISEHKDAYENNPVSTLNSLKEELSNRMKKVCLHIDLNTHYQTIEDAINYSYLKAASLNPDKASIQAEFKAKQHIATNLIKLANNRPDVLVVLDEVCQIYKSKLKKNQLQARNMETKVKPHLTLLRATLVLLFAPIATLGIMLNGFAFFSPVLIRKALKVEFIGFYSSIQFVLGLVTFPFFYGVQTWIIATVFQFTALYIVALLVFQFVTAFVAFEWYGLFKSTKADLILIFLPANKYGYLRELRAKIHTITLRNFTCNQP